MDKDVCVSISICEYRYIYTQWNISHKKRLKWLHETRMDLEIIILSEVNQKEKDRMMSSICGI